MNVAVILAGGTGARVGYGIPKQFIRVMDKPILAYTLEIFQRHHQIDAIEVVCHKDWLDDVERIGQEYAITKMKWVVTGGDTFQESTLNGVFHLKGILDTEDIVVISFGVSPMTPESDIDDGIRVCKEHGNAISSADIDLCTCIKDDEFSSSTSIIRETLKGFANPWTFRFGELCEAYETAIAEGILDTLEPHTTSVYFALGKRIWFSQCTTSNVKITRKEDIDLFEGYLLLQKKRQEEARKEKVL